MLFIKKSTKISIILILFIISVIYCDTNNNEKNINLNSSDDDDNYDENKLNDFLEKEEFEKSLESTFEKFKINKDSIISKETLKKMFIYLFNGEELKENSNMSEEELKNKEVLEGFFDGAFKRLTYDLEDEKINYTTIKEILSADKLGKVMEDSFSNIAGMFNENEDDL